MELGSLEKIVKENRGDWDRTIDHINNEADPVCRLDMLKEVPYANSKKLYEKLMGSIRLASDEIKQGHYELEQMASIDGLTGLYNRRYFDDSTERTISLADRTDNPASLIFSDIDYFKRFNDTYGHLAGDELLRNFGKLVRDRMRTSDIRCRYGGEEFTIILPNTDESGAYSAAEDLRKSVEDRHWTYDGKDLGKVSISLGVSTYVPNSKTGVRTFVKKADDALYLAKEGGRNRTEVYRG